MSDWTFYFSHIKSPTMASFCGRILKLGFIFQPEQNRNPTASDKRPKLMVRNINKKSWTLIWKLDKKTKKPFQHYTKPRVNQGEIRAFTALTGARAGRGWWWWVKSRKLKVLLLIVWYSIFVQSWVWVMVEQGGGWTRLTTQFSWQCLLIVSCFNHKLGHQHQLHMAQYTVAVSRLQS